MKKTAALVLAFLLLLLTGCGAKNDESIYFDNPDTQTATKTKVKQYKSQKCPDTISLFDRLVYSLQWDKNRVTITSPEAETDLYDSAVFDPSSNTLRFHIKKSDYDTSYVDCFFDGKGRLTDMSEISSDGRGENMHVAIAYSSKGTVVYGDRVYYDSEHEPRYSGSDTSFTMVLCRDADGYALRSTKNETPFQYSQWGDLVLNRDKLHAEYDKGGNLLRLTDEDGDFYSYTYANVDRSYWQNMVVSMLHSTALGAGGNGILNDYPILYQMGHQIVHSTESRSLYALEDTPAEVDDFPYEQVYSRLVDEETLQDILDQ